MSEKDEANLLAVLDAIDKIQRFCAPCANAATFYNDVKTFDATLMNFVIIGESVKRVSEALKSLHPQVEWNRIADFRNIIAHDYFGVDADEVWDIIQNHLPILKSRLLALLP